MSEVTLTRVFRKDVETKYGIKPKLSIQTSTHGDKWLSTFKVQGTENWNDGDTVKVNIQEKGDFINFEPIGGGSTSSASTASPQLEARVCKLEDAVFGKQNTTSPQAAAPAEDVIQADDLPFDEEEDGSGF